MKKTIKIGFKHFGPAFDPTNNFFTNLLRKRYNVIVSYKPDFLFYSVYNTRLPPKEIEKIGSILRRFSPNLYIISRKIFSKFYSYFGRVSFEQEGNPIKIFFASEHVRPNMEECDWAFGTHFEEDINNSRYTRLALYMINDYMLKDFGRPPIKKKINFKKIKTEKTKFCNFIYSQENIPRNNFFKRLNGYKRVDSPGRCMNNMAPIGDDTPKKSRDSKNWVKEKLKFIEPYKFTIAFENLSLPGWVTEKLTHPMLVNSIPIYIGHEKVKKEFNTKSFINFHDFRTMEEFVKHIIKVDNDDSLYEKYLKEPWYLKNKFPEHIDEQRIMKRFKKIFG